MANIEFTPPGFGSVGSSHHDFHGDPSGSSKPSLDYSNRIQEKNMASKNFLGFVGMPLHSTTMPTQENRMTCCWVPHWRMELGMFRTCMWYIYIYRAHQVRNLCNPGQQTLIKWKDCERLDSFYIHCESLRTPRSPFRGIFFHPEP